MRMKCTFGMALAAGFVGLIWFGGFETDDVYAAGAFADRDAVVAWIGKNPSQMTDLLEANLGQPALDALEALTVPPAASAEAELNILKRALARFKSEGVGTPTVIDPIQERITALEGG